MNTTNIGIHGLIDLDGFSPNPHNNALRLVRNADRIIAVDVTSQSECVLFGSDAAMVFDSSELRIELDSDMEDECLAAVAIVRTVKGSCDLEQIEARDLA